jgi:DNA ligase-1
MLFADLVATSQQVAGTSKRLEKIAALAACLRQMQPDEVAIGVLYLSGEVRQARLGIGYAMLYGSRADAVAAVAALTLHDVDTALDTLARTSGRGSSAQRAVLLRTLLSRATQQEQDFLIRLILGELRQGALEGVMIEAVARAADVSAAQVRRAAMHAGALAPVAEALLRDGAGGLQHFGIQMFQPIQPMLAQPGEDVAQALAEFGTAALDWKLDGARVQVHKDGAQVRAYTRSLNDVSEAVPEIVEAVAALPSRSLILDGEIIALASDGTPLPFQETMRRFGRRLDVAALRALLPLSAYFFDCLYRDGESLVDAPAVERFAALAEALPQRLTVPRLITGDQPAAEAFYRDALRRGHEGVMVKSLNAPYEAGSRGSSWLKLKHVHTLDLVVLAAEWGNGRRSGWLSNLHLGARDSSSDGYVMLGKTFKGMTDDMLSWQTHTLLGLEVARERHIVHVRPELVVEIAFNDIQASSQYPGGLALRFARVKRYRRDKTAAQADTIDTVRAIFAAQAGRQYRTGSDGDRVSPG